MLQETGQSTVENTYSTATEEKQSFSQPAQSKPRQAFQPPTSLLNGVKYFILFWIHLTLKNINTGMQQLH